MCPRGEIALATPVGHLLLAAAITQSLARNDKERKLGLLISPVALLPDFDIVLGLLSGYIWEYHRGISHSLAMAVIFGVVSLIGLKLWRVRSPVYLSMLISLAYASHVVLDYLVFDNARVPGVQIIWPLSSELYQSPLTLLPSLFDVGNARFGFNSVVAVLREILLLAPLYAMVYTLKSKRVPWPRQMAWMYGSVFVAVVVATLALT